MLRLIELSSTVECRRLKDSVKNGERTRSVAHLAAATFLKILAVSECVIREDPWMFGNQSSTLSLVHWNSRPSGPWRLRVSEAAKEGTLHDARIHM